MATEKNKEVVFEYLSFENRRENLPIIKIKMILGGQEYPNNWMDAVLDTGYDGGLLIPFERYREANLQQTELPVEDWDIAEAINGRLILLQAASSRMKIKDMKDSFEIRVETFQDNTTTLIGLNGIKSLLISLDGSKEVVKVMK